MQPVDIAMDVDSNFKSQFYNLQGVHINERKKNFYKLLKSTSFDIRQDQTDIQPRNFLEKLFYIDILIHFKKTDHLIEILKEGNGVFVSKILKQPWFFQDAFKDMSEEDLVNRFLPCLSYSLRMKVLKKLALSLAEERMNRIFDCVLQRYGLHIAINFLFSCSPKKIIEILENNEVTLLPEQLKRFFQKDPYLIPVYLKEYNKRGCRFDDIDFLRYLTWKNPELYFDLFIKSKSAVKLGRCTTKNLLKSKRADVLKEVKEVGTRLNISALTREIKDFDKSHLVTFFPSNMKDIGLYRNSSVITKVIRSYPVKKRWHVLSQAFLQAYNENISNHLELVANLSEFFSQEIIHKWGMINYQINGDTQYLRCCDAKIALPLIKEKINLTSDINQRGRLLNVMIAVATEGKDYGTLEQVLKYICFRHRNEDKHVRADITRTISRNIDYDCLTENHWKYINEMIDLQRLKGEMLCWKLVSEHLIWVLKSKIPLEGPVKQFVKDIVKYKRPFILEASCSKQEEGIILKYVIEVISNMRIAVNTLHLISGIMSFNETSEGHQIYLSDYPIFVNIFKKVCSKQNDYNYDDFLLVSKLLLYNRITPKHQIKVCDEQLLNVVKNLLAYQPYGNLCSEVVEILLNVERNDFQNDLLNYFFSELFLTSSSTIRKKIVNYFMNNEPEVVVKFYDKILQADIRNNVLNYSLIKRYSHLSLDEKLIAYCKSRLLSESDYATKKSIFVALSKIMNTQDYISVVKGYEPKSAKLDLDNEEQREMYECEIVTNFKNVESPKEIAPLLMKFCLGDYLQFSLQSLYSVLYNLDQKTALICINVLKERAVSARKHAVFLGFEVLPIQNALDLYSTVCSNESNVSNKKYLFRSVLKYFLRNPLEDLLDIVIMNMKFVDKNDPELIQMLIESVTAIPQRYKPVFVEKVWNLLEILEVQDVNVADYQNSLLETINANGAKFFLNFSEDFCKSLIEHYFLSDNELLRKNVSNLHNFVVNFLIASTDDKHYEFIFSIIKNHKDKYWSSDCNEKVKHIFSFFGDSYKKFAENDEKCATLFEHYWEQIFSPVECFYEYLALRLMVFHKQNPSVDEFAKEVDKFFEGLVGYYEPYIGEFIYDSVKIFFKHTSHLNEFNSILFAYHLLMVNTSTINCLVAWHIITEHGNRDGKNKAISDKVVDILKGVNDVSVQICCNVLFKPYESIENCFIANM